MAEGWYGAAFVVRPLSVLLAACAAALAVFVSVGSPAAAVGGCTPGAGFRPANAAFADQVVQLVNQHRATLGLRALKVSPSLSASAVWKARHMATYSYMAHDDPAPPVARTAADRIAACGYRGGWGENIAAGFTTPAAVLAAWLQSPGHRANIENPAYVVTGAGASVTANGVTVWAQDFGLTDDSGSTGPPCGEQDRAAEAARDTACGPSRPARARSAHTFDAAAAKGKHRLRRLGRRPEVACGCAPVLGRRGDLCLARSGHFRVDQGDALCERAGGGLGTCHPGCRSALATGHGTDVADRGFGGSPKPDQPPAAELRRPPGG